MQTLEDEHLAEAYALAEAVRPLFAGHAPDVIGAALAQLTALWLAGFQAPDAPAGVIDHIRSQALAFTTETTLQLVPAMEAELAAALAHLEVSS